MKKFFIKKYVDKITISDIEKFAKSNNILLSQNELSYIYQLIKENWEQILNNDDSILLKLKTKFDNDTYQKIEKLYYESFDKDERFPFWLLKKCCKENNVKFNVIYNNDKVIGFQYIIEYDNIAYLMYFAIEKNQRNNGYG